jgi:hypothetical protein
MQTTRYYRFSPASVTNPNNAQNVAFASFLGFTVLQNVFAFVAHSQSMMADCAGALLFSVFSCSSR